MLERQIYYDCKDNETICHCVPCQHGVTHHAAGQNGGAKQQPILHTGDERGVERAERRVEPWAGMPCPDQIRQGKSDGGLY